MDFISQNLLTILILFPVFGAVATLAHQMFWKQESQLKWVTLGFTVVNFLLSLILVGWSRSRIGERIHSSKRTFRGSKRSIRTSTSVSTA
jgi:NADH:ubiquinone oxidoreductase subunit 4 (subunit M)